MLAVTDVGRGESGSLSPQIVLGPASAPPGEEFAQQALALGLERNDRLCSLAHHPLRPSGDAVAGVEKYVTEFTLLFSGGHLIAYESTKSFCEL